MLTACSNTLRGFNFPAISTLVLTFRLAGNNAVQTRTRNPPTKLVSEHDYKTISLPPKYLFQMFASYVLLISEKFIKYTCEGADIKCGEVSPIFLGYNIIKSDIFGFN